ncbi:hypothetical protein GCM10027277_49700 [Pseudoduganella ginsengisoli]|uniref:CPBP family intramembrane metalloprotease n=1 Tax=Pseudoduganella ginsengisoli TaxID=1462440 RepID=A0A6L6Q4G6_9BURK|nr:CPBP family intramembrane glutamic endopeptidase [Pseudoduganella ginsengisoli]MTW04590.1 CPBP family intramembrane metalloprotease [Pseudoduganella ginsengisoli]
MPLPELLLVLYLLLVLPAHAIWRSRQAGGMERPRMKIYVSNITRLVLLLLALAVCAAWSGYTARQMGVAWPPGTAGLWGLAAALGGLAAMMLGSGMYERRMRAGKRAAIEAQMREDKAMPSTPREMAVFAVLSVLLGAGWELLYRGFLLLVLAPVVGLAGAVALSAVAYGSGHGFHGWKPYFISIATALAFTLAYVWTGSLWWLMVIHITLPLSAGWSIYRKKRYAITEPSSA